MTWNLISQSFAVLRRDKQLVVFPALSVLGAIGLTAPYLWVFTGGRLSGVHWPDHFNYWWLFLWSCTVSFPTIFFNCALAACAQTRFSGGEPSIADGIRQAGSRAGRIFLWAMVTSTVGVLIRYIEDRVGWIGRIVAALFGASWSLATYLIVPVLVVEDLDVVESIRRSAMLLKKTWGEQLVVGLHFMWMILLLAIPGVILGALALPLGILYFVALAAVMTAARQIFMVALYRFAVSGEAPDGYSREALGGFFRSR